MGTVANFLLFSFVVAVAENAVTLEADRPFERVKVLHPVSLKCCFTTTAKPPSLKWVKQSSNKSEGLFDVTSLDRVAAGRDGRCGILTFKEVHLADSGLYRCALNDSRVHKLSHGTFLQVYKLMDKTINLSESTKNKILVAEGVVLLLCVLVPSFTLILKSKRLGELEKKKAKKEEENIYQGLNLDECWSTYDQIERSQAHGQYEDVGNAKEEEEQIQLEKP